MTAFKVDFTQDDIATTGARGFEPLPSGFYETDITDIEITEVKNGPNAGKSMFRVEVTISEGETHENRKLWFNVMLFNIKSGNWFLAQFLKATGNAAALESGEIPSIEEFEGKHIVCSVRKKKDDYRTKKMDDGVTYFKNEVNGFKLEQADEIAVGKDNNRKRNSILP